MGWDEGAVLRRASALRRREEVLRKGPVALRGQAVPSRSRFRLELRQGQ